ncbi:MAG: hypothetical protein MI924_18985 [Chloroflexales bacterium]|nr:hypothetical protein [Chloroflexales bacterium]
MTTAEPSAFAGTWDVVEAILPDGVAAYTGTITIAHMPPSFVLDWDITAGRYVGIGLAIYKPTSDGHVAIRWCSGERPDQVGTGRFASAWTGAFTGEHTMVYYLPDGRIYGEWTLVVRQTGQTYDVLWQKADQVHFRGIGLATPHGLAVGWYPDRAQLAFLDYQPVDRAAQQLTAVWALGTQTTLGTEHLSRACS